MKWTSNEYQECKAFYEWAQLNPITKDYLFKIVNEGKRNVITGARFKAIGMRAGVPDYCLPVANLTWHSLWIEMKVPGERFKSRQPKQDEWIAKLNKIGHYAKYCYGWHDAAQLVTDYLANRI